MKLYVIINYSSRGLGGSYIYMMNKLVYEINKNRTSLQRKKKPKNMLLFDLQMKYSELYKEVEDILDGKKGRIRQLIGG